MIKKIEIINLLRLNTLIKSFLVKEQYNYFFSIKALTINNIFTVYTIRYTPNTYLP